jgi:hypothetical protein
VSPLSVWEWDDLVSLATPAVVVSDELAARIRTALVERDSWQATAEEFSRAFEEVTASGVFRDPSGVEAAALERVTECFSAVLPPDDVAAARAAIAKARGTR